jgi:iron complex transport system permease protein
MSTAIADDAPAAPATGRRRIAHGRRARQVRSVVVAVLLAAAGAVLVCLSVASGEVVLPLRDVVGGLTGRADPATLLIVRDLRLPRALTAVLVGAAFGMSGAIFQTLVRNPLASPDIVGVTAGASAGAVLVIVVGGGGAIGVPAGAIGGGVLATLAVYLLAYRGGVSGHRLVLVGIGVAALLAGLVGYLLTRAEIFDAQRAFVWLTGSLNGRGWEHVRPVGTALLVLLVPALLLERTLRVLALGDAVARGLGIRVEPAKLALVGIGVALASVATAAAGPVAFVAFVAAPVARRLAGAGGSALVTSGMVGAVLLLAADLVARAGLGWDELPVGVVTGALGACALMLILVRAERVR